MKKYISLILVVSLCLCLFSACGAKRQLLGTWEYTVDLSEAVQYILTEEQLGEGVTVSDFTVTAQLRFFKNGDFWLQLDEEQLTAQTDALLTKLEDHLIDTLQVQLGEQQVSIPIEELLTMSGFNKDVLIQQLRQQFPTQLLTEQLGNRTTLAGCYQLKGDKLLLGPDKDSLRKDCYITYVLKDNTLELSEAVGENIFLEGNLVLGTLPKTFTKSN